MMIFIWLVVEPPTPLKKYEFVSWDDDIPNIWRKKTRKYLIGALERKVRRSQRNGFSHGFNTFYKTPRKPDRKTPSFWEIRLFGGFVPPISVGNWGSKGFLPKDLSHTQLHPPENQVARSPAMEIPPCL